MMIDKQINKLIKYLIDTYIKKQFSLQKKYLGPPSINFHDRK